jgi:hypothetical protein
MEQLPEVEVHENMPPIRARQSKIHDVPTRTPSDKLQSVPFYSEDYIYLA